MHNIRQTRSVAARCGQLTVPEDYARPEGPKVELFVAVIPARTKTPAPDAVTAIAGGPGGAATDDYVNWGQTAFSDLLKTRDIVLIDQRGTGRSNRFDCPFDPDGLADATPEEIKAANKACIESFSGDPRFYTTTEAVKDLEAVRTALGYSKLNVYGVSYGTRVALEYLRRYPQSVRTTVLDGVAPADLALGPGIPLAAQNALD
ncbi:MAG: alpha/beta fold hydrolase, partial [Myxococcota bacterium]